MRYVIEHETLLSFPKSVREHQCELRLAPRESESQRRVACEIEVEPDATLRTHVDAFGNLVHRLSLLAPHEGLRARVSAEVETTLDNPFDYNELSPADERCWQERQLRDAPSLYDFVLHRSLAVPDLAAEIAGCAVPRYATDQTLLANTQAAMAWAGDTFVYESGATEVHGALSEFFERRAGVCQDFAHLTVALVRSWGFAARYAMGYVDPGVTETHEPVQATHAWAEVMIPDAGWRGFDATSGLVTNGAYIPVAVGRESRDAAPVRGTFKGDDGGTAPRVSVRVMRKEAQEQQAQ
ncbi:MAG: transglutaminase family protein [Proteobacteria bacterium]|nr:transglutaminase family protein [Pseudomonadota bacterium]